MKYTIKELPDGTHMLLRYGDMTVPNRRPNNAELEFWFELEELKASAREASYLLEDWLDPMGDMRLVNKEDIEVIRQLRKLLEK